MPWPDIFWKRGKPKTESEPVPAIKAAPEPAKPALAEAQPPTIKPVPVTATVGPQNASVPTPVKVEAKPEVKMEPAAEVKSPTLPATHGVVLRPPTGRTTPASISAPTFQPPRAVTPPRAQGPLKNIEQLMAEADPVQTLRQTGNLRVLKPLTAPDTAPLPTVSLPKPEPAAKVDAAPNPIPMPAPPARLAPLPLEPPAGLMATPPPFRPAVTPPQESMRRVFVPAPSPVAMPLPVPTPTPSPEPPPIPVAVTPVAAPEENDSPFILKPAPMAATPPPMPSPTPATPEPAASTPPPIPAPAAATPEGSTSATSKLFPPNASATLSPVSSILRRKARMADVARIVLPPKREDTQQLHPTPIPKPIGPSPTVVPPAFPVAAMTARATQQMPRIVVPEPVQGDVAPEKIVTENKPAASILTPSVDAEDSFILKPEKKEPVKTEPAQDKAPEPMPPVEKPFEAKVDPAPIMAVAPEPPPLVEAKPVEPLIGTTDAPKLDPEAHKPEISATLEPKLDPEAHKPAPTPAPPEPVKASAPEPAPDTTVSTKPEKREFHLANGERVAGTVISETPESVYIEHATLGVLTIPRSNIAKRLVEIILINGDRIVGDIMAETPDTLYVRHASLGMLTVPRAQRSTRVVEAILKDGDRILGEVLTETDAFTVIRSATLGTITIPHTKLAMLNRKLEQIEMRSLPPPVPELKDK